MEGFVEPTLFEAKYTENKESRCEHGCKSNVQIVSKTTGQVIVECCVREARTLGSSVMREALQFIKRERIDLLKAQEEQDKRVEAGDIFCVVHQNGYEAPYVITSTIHGYHLTNLNSGQSNYEGDSIEQLIENFLHAKLEVEGNVVNPITHTYVVKRYHAKFQHEKNFNLQEIKKERR